MKRLYRSEHDRMLCGLCAGIGEYLVIDPTLVRLAWVLLSLCSCGFGLLAYLVAAIVVPTESKVQMTNHD